MAVPRIQRKAYILMSICEHLPKQAKRDSKEIDWTKGRELAKPPWSKVSASRSEPGAKIPEDTRARSLHESPNEELSLRDSVAARVLYQDLQKPPSAQVSAVEGFRGDHV